MKKNKKELIYNLEETGKSLLDLLKDDGHYIRSSCGGHASCGECLVKITSGEEFIHPVGFEEEKLIGNVFHITKQRLACQVKGFGRITVDASNHDKLNDEKKIDKKNIKVRRPQEIEKIKQEREDRKNEKISNENSWQKHWEKEDKVKGRLGGGQRPKQFKYLEENNFNKKKEEK